MRPPQNSSPKSARVNVREIARRSGFSKSLVALALKDDGRVAAATRRKIQRVAEKLGYTTNPVVAHLMAQLRISRSPTFQCNLALINCSRDAAIFRWHTFRDFRDGVREGAARLGYGIDDFWMYEPDMRPARLAQIFWARQIPGVIFVAALDAEIIHSAYDELWSLYPTAAIGIVKTEPQIACASCDHFQICKEAAAEVISRGYRCPGLVIDPALDELLDRRFSGGFLAAVETLRTRTPVCFCRTDQPEVFARWRRRHKPDCLITAHHEVKDWLEADGVEIPDGVGVAHLDWHEGLRGWAGMLQNNRVAGACAVDLVVHQLHAREKGAPTSPKLTMIEGQWVDGETVRSKKTGD